MQYSISNLNSFIILITIGYTFIGLNKDTKRVSSTSENIESHKDAEIEDLKDRNLSPIQLINQLKGYFYINPLLSISLAITLFSFIGVPPLLGFFAKQMILSAALDNGYVFMSLLAILTSVISAVYYLVVIQKIFFDKNEYNKNNKLQDFQIKSTTLFAFPSLGETKKEGKDDKVIVNTSSIILSSSLTAKISILTLSILLFIFIPKEILCLNNIMSILLFYN